MLNYENELMELHMFMISCSLLPSLEEKYHTDSESSIEERSNHYPQNKDGMGTKTITLLLYITSILLLKHLCRRHSIFKVLLYLDML